MRRQRRSRLLIGSRSGLAELGARFAFVRAGLRCCVLRLGVGRVDFIFNVFFRRLTNYDAGEPRSDVVILDCMVVSHLCLVRVIYGRPFLTN